MSTSGTIIKAITIVIITIILLALTPVVVAQVQEIVYHGTSGSAITGEKWNFTGSSGALSMMGLVPFVWVAGVLLAAVIGMLALYKGEKGKD